MHVCAPTHLAHKRGPLLEVSKHCCYPGLDPGLTFPRSATPSSTNACNHGVECGVDANKFATAAIIAVSRSRSVRHEGVVRLGKHVLHPANVSLCAQHGAHYLASGNARHAAVAPSAQPQKSTFFTHTTFRMHELQTWPSCIEAASCKALARGTLTVSIT
jgi:hypothetical protein